MAMIVTFSVTSQEDVKNAEKTTIAPSAQEQEEKSDSRVEDGSQPRYSSGRCSCKVSELNEDAPTKFQKNYGTGKAYLKADERVTFTKVKGWDSTYGVLEFSQKVKSGKEVIVQLLLHPRYSWHEANNRFSLPYLPDAEGDCVVRFYNTVNPGAGTFSPVDFMLDKSKRNLKWEFKIEVKRSSKVSDVIEGQIADGQVIDTTDVLSITPEEDIDYLISIPEFSIDEEYISIARTMRVVIPAGIETQLRFNGMLGESEIVDSNTKKQVGIMSLTFPTRTAPRRK